VAELLRSTRGLLVEAPDLPASACLALDCALLAADLLDLPAAVTGADVDPVWVVALGFGREFRPTLVGPPANGQQPGGESAAEVKARISLVTAVCWSTQLATHLSARPDRDDGAPLAR
jgi:hypothetical protein